MTDDETDDGVRVEHVSVPAWERDLLLDRTEQSGLVVLPRAVRDRLGEYREDDLQAVKALRAAGVSVDYAHPASERTFASEYGATEVALAIGFFVAQALGQESVVEVARWLLVRVRQAFAAGLPGVMGPTFVIKVDRLKVDGNRREIVGLSITGRDERIVDAVASLLRGDPPPR